MLPGSKIILIVLLAISLATMGLGAKQVFKSESSKLKALQALETSNGVLELSHDAEALKKFVFQGPRDYNVVLSLISNTERLNCPICREWDPVFLKVASAYSKLEQKSNRLFFVRVDVTMLPKEVLQMITSKIRGLPFVALIEPTNSKALKFEFEEKRVFYQILDGAVGFALWVNKEADVHIRIIDYSRITIITLGAIIIAISVYLKFDWLWKMAHEPMVYFAASIVGYSIVCGGTLFSLIHKTPLIAVDHQGSSHWIMPGSREQLGAESIIMAVVVGGGAIGWVLLSSVLPSKSTSPRYKIAIWSALIVTFLFMVIGRRLFQFKHPYYPY